MKDFLSGTTCLQGKQGVQPRNLCRHPWAGQAVSTRLQVDYWGYASPGLYCLLLCSLQSHGFTFLARYVWFLRLFSARVNNSSFVLCCQFLSQTRSNANTSVSLIHTDE